MTSRKQDNVRRTTQILYKNHDTAESHCHRDASHTTNWYPPVADMLSHNCNLAPALSLTETIERIVRWIHGYSVFDIEVVGEGGEGHEHDELEDEIERQVEEVAFSEAGMVKDLTGPHPPNQDKDADERKQALR